MMEERNDVFAGLRKLASKIDEATEILSRPTANNQGWLRFKCTGNDSENPMSKLLTMSKEMKHLKEKMKAVKVDVQREIVALRDMTESCRNVLTDRDSQATNLEDYLAQYGYITWEQHKKEMAEKENKKSRKKERVHSLENISEVTGTVPEKTVEEITEKETDEESDESEAPPRIEDFSFSRYFMEHILTTSTTKRNYQTPQKGEPHRQHIMKRLYSESDDSSCTTTPTSPALTTPGLKNTLVRGGLTRRDDGEDGDASVPLSATRLSSPSLESSDVEFNATCLSFMQEKRD